MDRRLAMRHPGLFPCAALLAWLGGTATLASPASSGPDPATPPVVHARTDAAADAAPVCDSTTALTVIGMDTASGKILFAAASATPAAPPTPSSIAGGAGSAAAGWVIELESKPGAGDARAYAERSAGRYGGSVGPGAVLAVEPCGPDCLQPVRWSEGTWQPLGDTLTVPNGSTFAATYDESGAPWLLAHAAGTQPGQLRAWSYRFEGHEWKTHGGLEVTAVGQPQVLPAPQRRDGVISGTGLFAASGSPATWVAGLPGVAPERRGQLLALPGAAVAYISADGVAYLSADSGKSWRRSTWTPWGGGDTTGIWRQGTDYGIDLPLGDHRGALQLVWFDRRVPAAEQVLLTRLAANGDWVQLGQAPADVTTRNGDHLPVTQVLVPRADSWILLSGCAATAGGPGLVLRSFDNGRLSEARFVPIHTQP